MKRELCFFESDDDEDESDVYNVKIGETKQQQSISIKSDENSTVTIAGKECALCGDLMIESISWPFIDMETERDIITSWEI